jgi:hypothetical protein
MKIGRQLHGCTAIRYNEILVAGGRTSNRFLDSVEVRVRVTRLGDFSPIWRLFTLATFWKITEVPQIFGMLFPCLILCIKFEKKWFGLHFGRLCHKLIWSPWSGWPDWAIFRLLGDYILWPLFDNYKSSLNFWATFFHSSGLTKMICAIFYNSSGHPVRGLPRCQLALEIGEKSAAKNCLRTAAFQPSNGFGWL